MNIQLKGCNTLMAGPGRILKRESLRGVISAFTGENPIVNEYGDYDEIDFTENQKRILSEQLTKWKNSEPGEVRVKVGGILLPWSAKNYWMYLAGIFGIGLIIGRLIKK